MTEAEKLDVRAEIAVAAGAAVGNITKVRQIMAAVHPSILEALRDGEVSIHRAWGWRQHPLEEQKNMLLQYRSERGIKKTIRELISQHRAKKNEFDLDLNNLGFQLSTLCPSQVNTVKIGIVKSLVKSFI